MFKELVKCESGNPKEAMDKARFKMGDVVVVTGIQVEPKYKDHFEVGYQLMTKADYDKLSPNGTPA